MKFRRKLALKRETVRQLNLNLAQRVVAGGADYRGETIHPGSAHGPSTATTGRWTQTYPFFTANPVDFSMSEPGPSSLQPPPIPPGTLTVDKWKAEPSGFINSQILLACH